jgi:hypothetical protein
MAGINTGKVVTGGLLAGLVFNVLDFISNSVLFAADLSANFTRLGLDPAAMENASGIATWVIIDFLMGIVAVWTYAAIRPRFGPGAKTAAYAGAVLWLAIFLVMFGLTRAGMFPMGVSLKYGLMALVTNVVGTIAGAWAYKEA